MATFKDLREWLKQAEGMGELKVVEGVDPFIELGTITQINAKNEGPAVLFKKIKGYREDFQLLTNSVGNMKLINMTFGLPVENSLRETVETLRIKVQEWIEAAKRFPVRFVNSGPILENVEEEDDVDLTKFPSPTWHELDGGKYIGTGVGVVTRDPDTGKVNIGTYRVMLHDSKSVGFYISPGKHGRLHRDKFFAQNKPCPVVMVFGWDPLNFMISASEIPGDVFELELVGAIRGEPVPVIQGKYTGLPIPANAEIAIEGFSDPQETKLEGPFGEWTGTYGSAARQEPFVKVKALYYRNEPIILGSPPAKSVYNDHALFRAVWRSALLYNEIVRAGVPNVSGVWCPPFGGSRQFVIVSIKQSYAGHAAQAGHVACQTRAGAYAGRYVVVVDDDINPYDIHDVLWALCNRSDPVEDIDFVKKAWSTPLDPRIKKPTDSYHNSRAIIYAVKPYEWYNEYPATVVASEEERKRVFDRWGQTFGARWKDI